MTVLRLATVEDAPAGADMQMACWREAYGPLVEPALLDAQLGDRSAWVERWVRRRTDGVGRLVAEAPDGALVGFATAGPGRGEGDAPTELYALYVRASQHGSGLGQALFDAVVPAGVPCSLWVLEPNARARAFYARYGFVADGARRAFEPLGAWEVRMWRA
jgi:GNAT superfamily N-acetyltransferase